MPLIFVQFADHTITQMETHQATEIAGAEPWLVFQEEGMEGEVVASEDCCEKGSDMTDLQVGKVLE